MRPRRQIRHRLHHRAVHRSPEVIFAVNDITGKPGMVSRGKIAELYHLDWVSGACGFTLSGPISFAMGFRETLAWYVAAGWLPRGTRIDRTGDNDKDVTS